MSLLTHVFVALSYLSLAVGLGLGLPQAAPDVVPTVAVALGALSGLFVHHICIRSGHDQTLREDLALMRRSQGALQDELNTSAAHLLRIEEELV